MESVQPEAPVAEPAEVVEASASEEPKWNYQVGDTVYLDDTAFRVEQITDREVQLRDPTLAYPIFRAENRENFERMLSQDERNHAVRVDAQTEEKPVTEDFLGKTEPRDYTPEYQLLDRLRMDCEYFLGAGQHSEKHLWAGNRHAQIAKMRELYEMIPDKPEWLTPEMINSYEERMAPRYLVAAYHHFENGFDDKLDYYTLEEAEKAAQGYVDGTMRMTDSSTMVLPFTISRSISASVSMGTTLTKRHTHRSEPVRNPNSRNRNTSSIIFMLPRTFRSGVRWTSRNTVPLMMPCEPTMHFLTRREKPWVQ